MKRLINVVSLTAIAASLAALIWIYGPIQSRAVGAAELRVNETRVVNFRCPPEVLERFTDGEVEDQLRDWLLYAVMGESGLPLDAMQKAMFDIPPSRAGYVKPVAAFQFGPVRFRVSDAAGSTVALIPAGSRYRGEYLAQVADAVRSSLGSQPGTVRVYEYNLNPAEFSATLVRKADIPGSELFTPAYGYVREVIASVQQLDSFLKEIDDIVWVEPVSGGIQIGGRIVKDARARKMRVEDVAAIWQSESRLASDRDRIAEFERRWNDKETRQAMLEPIYRSERADILRQYGGQPDGASTQTYAPDQMDAAGRARLLDELLQGKSSASATGPNATPAWVRRWRKGYGGPLVSGGILPGSPGGRELALAQFDAKWKNGGYAKALLQQRYDSEFAELKKTMSSKGSEGIPTSSGFSLDPAYDYKKLRELFDALRPMLARFAPSADLDSIAASVNQQKEGPLLDLCYKLQTDGGPGGELITGLAKPMLESARFQHARYDGNLYGTEVGMVLFYTDLLAKLWALDYEESAPDNQVAGFIPLLKVSVSPIYAKEIEQLSGTRLWFGPRDSAFAKTANGLYFSRIATRVYAASSNTLQPGKEAEANAESSLFLGWWNDHYSQVADFEPQYQRLNQIMKWSVVVGWLSGTNTLDRLNWLDGYPVAHGGWFPVWAEHNPELRFKAWDRVKFYPAGYNGVETEAMPMLRSRAYASGHRRHWLSGGVSLGSRAEIMERPALSETIDPLLRRANVSEIAGANGERTIQSLDKISYDLSRAELGEPANVILKGTTKLRGEDIELKPGAFKMTFDRAPSGIDIRLDENGLRIGALRVSRGAHTSTDVLFAPSEIEYSRVFSKTLGNAIGRGDNPLSALACRPDVARAVRSGDIYYAELSGPPGTWLKVYPEGAGGSANISNDANLRFAGLGADDSPRWNVAFLDRNGVGLELKNAGYVVAQPAPTPLGGTAFEVLNKGPPPGGTGFADLSKLPANQRDALAYIDEYSSRHPSWSVDGPGGGRTGGKGPGGDGPGGSGTGFTFGGEGPEFIARKAALDPDHTLLFLAETRKPALARTDQLIADGRFEQARIELDQLARLYPDDPEILVRRIVAHASSEPRAAAAVAARTPMAKDRIPSLLDAADAALPKLRSDAGALARLDAVVRMMIAKSGGADAHLVNLSHELGVEVRFAGLGREAADTAPPGALRYSLESVDPGGGAFHAPPAPSASEPITGKLRFASVGPVRPDVITDTRTGEHYLLRSGGGGGPPIDSFRRTYGARVPNCQSTDPSEGPRGNLARQNGCLQEVYVARPAPAPPQERAALR